VIFAKIINVGKETNAFIKKKFIDVINVYYVFYIQCASEYRAQLVQRFVVLYSVFVAGEKLVSVCCFRSVSCFLLALTELMFTKKRPRFCFSNNTVKNRPILAVS